MPPLLCFWFERIALLLDVSTLHVLTLTFTPVSRFASIFIIYLYYKCSFLWAQKTLLINFVVHTQVHNLPVLTLFVGQAEHCWQEYYQGR